MRQMANKEMKNLSQGRSGPRKRSRADRKHVVMHHRRACGSTASRRDRQQALLHSTPDSPCHPAHAAYENIKTNHILIGGQRTLKHLPA
jgi:hypothetical protein